MDPVVQSSKLRESQEVVAIALLPYPTFPVDRTPEVFYGVDT
jgi:hypothetical protein